MTRREVSDEAVVAYVRREFDDAIRKVLRPDDVVIAGSWDELRNILRTRRVALALVDPSASGRLEGDYILDLLRSFPAIPMRAYVSLTAPEFKAIAYLSRHGLEDVILHGTDDISPHFASTLTCYRSIPLVAEIVGILEPQLIRLPAGLERTLRDIFQNPQKYSSTTDISRDAGITIGMLYRCFENVKLTSPKKVIIAAKVLRGCSYMLDPGASVQGVAKKLGYSDARGFAEHVGLVFSRPPSAIRNEGALEILVPHLQRWLRGATKTSTHNPAARRTASAVRRRRAG